MYQLRNVTEAVNKEKLDEKVTPAAVNDYRHVWTVYIKWL